MDTVLVPLEVRIDQVRDDYKQKNTIKEFILNNGGCERGGLRHDNQLLICRHIDLVFDSIQSHSRNTCLSIANNWRVEEIIRNKFLMQESQEIDKIFVANVNNMHWILITNINPLDAEYKQRLEQEWFVYDSLNNINNCMATSHIVKLFYPEQNFHKIIMVQVEQQEGTNDCGLFAIAYAQLLANGKDPYNNKFDQR
ncbi:hypothetical protein BpHYR1_047572 [Brachionus plicatilis]|uniref:Ubiquitin-like protease family profile domain-containing protein n=1 Tax=Brachionus plicatilis TaxID=10195 RepID=A0A3M7SRJ9_BRAPC|nr:hypothetical protein BpHYR1_047572 [Brachionus plicatilis]